jgi:hypothetical protein
MEGVEKPLVIVGRKVHYSPMNFPQYWAKGKSAGFECWRWSSQSLAEAQSLASQAAQQLADRFRSGAFPPKHGGYYPDRPLREQVMRAVKGPAGESAAVVTRNAYGCLVLNTARVMFVDIDLPEPEPRASGGFFKRLFGKPDLPPPPATDGQGPALTRVENWTRDHPEWGWRIYRTRAGLRLMAMQGLVEADSEVAGGVFEALGADPLYRKLCKSQKCFRARLTPKPWRCGLHGSPERWPWLDARAESKFQKWEAQYQAASSNWATCQLVSQIGNAAVHEEVQPIVKLHDAATRVDSKLQLA